MAHTPDTYPHILRITLKHEGGFSDHPADPGGATMRGITQRTYDSYRKRRGLPLRPVREIEEAELQDIYRGIWDSENCDSLPPALALNHFDATVNHGPRWSRGFLTEAAGDWRRYMSARIQFFTELRHFTDFGRGWMRRCADVQLESIALDAAPTPTPTPGLVILYDEAGAEVARTPIPAGATALTRIDLVGGRVHVRPDVAR